MMPEIEFECLSIKILKKYVFSKDVGKRKRRQFHAGVLTLNIRKSCEIFSLILDQRE